MDKKIIRGKLSWFRGIIISDATVIERALGWRLRTYFFPKTNQQASDFIYNITETSSFNFDKKISLYEQISYFKNLKQYSKVKNSLRFIQLLRNALAHWDLNEKMSNEDEIVIYNPANFKGWEKAQRLKLNNETMERFQEHEKFLLKVFGWEQTLKEKKEFAAKSSEAQSSAKSGTKNLKSSNPKGSLLRAEGGSGGNSARRANRSQFRFGYFQTDTASWEKKRLARPLRGLATRF